MEPVLNDHNKAEYPPAHTAEHLLNQTMVRMFGCERSRNAHIERKKSKLNYDLAECPTAEQIAEVERQMNCLIAEDLPVTYEFVTRDTIPAGVKLDKLPDDASETLRLVRIGDYDVCPCIGTHVASTREIGQFRISSTSYNEGSFRIVFRLDPPAAAPALTPHDFMQMAIDEARQGITQGHGGPFGAVIVKEGRVIARAHNRVLANHDATAHGEVMAIREAGRVLGTHDLSGCELYTTGEPCHMCLCAILWANIQQVYYGCTIADNGRIGFRDDKFNDLFGGRDRLGSFLTQVDRESCLALFDEYNHLQHEGY